MFGMCHQQGLCLLVCVEYEYILVKLETISLDINYVLEGKGERRQRRFSAELIVKARRKVRGDL